MVSDLPESPARTHSDGARPDFCPAALAVWREVAGSVILAVGGVRGAPRKGVVGSGRRRGRARRVGGSRGSRNFRARRRSYA